MVQGFKPSIEKPADDNEHPLVEFKGILKDYKAEEAVFGAGTENERKTMRISFNFTDVEVIQSRSPYPLQVATIPVTYNERGGTRWAALTETMRNVLPEANIDLLLGKKQHWQWGNITLRGPRRDAEGNNVKGTNGRDIWENQPAEGWTILEVEGYGSTTGGANGAQASSTLNDTVLAMFNGKTKAEFLQAFYQNAEIRNMAGYEKVMEQMTTDQLIPALLATGKLTEANGVFTVVE